MLLTKSTTEPPSVSPVQMIVLSIQPAGRVSVTSYEPAATPVKVSVSSEGSCSVKVPGVIVSV